MKTFLILVALWCSCIAPLGAQEIQSRFREPIDTSHIDTKGSVTSTSTTVQGVASTSNVNSLAGKTATPCQIAHPYSAELVGIFPDLFCCSLSAIPHQQNACLEANYLKLSSLAGYLEKLQNSGWASNQLICDSGVSGANFPPQGMDPDVYAVSMNAQAINQCLIGIGNLEDSIKEKFGAPK